jgi:hypothetical protein
MRSHLVTSRARRVGFAFLVLLEATICSYSADQPGWLQKRVCRFIFHGGNPDKSTHNPGVGPLGIGTAAVALAHQAEVPICIESLPAISIETGDTVAPIEIDATDVTVREILDEMIREDPRYTYRERLGVIELLPEGADRDPANCLNLVIPSFKERSTWNGLISDLRIRVAIVAKSAKDGAVRGGSGVAVPPAGYIEADFENRTLRDILGALCAKVGNMAWAAHFEGPRPACEGISFGTYKPRMSYPLNTVPLTYSDGLPRDCLTCHYHQPCRSRKLSRDSR